MAVLTDGQFELRDLVFGKNTLYPITGAPDLGNTELRVEDVARPFSHGATAGIGLYGTKQLVFPIAVLGTDQDHVWLLHRELGKANRPLDPNTEGTTTALRFRLGGVDYRAIGHPGRLALDSTEAKSGTLEGILSFMATDPRFYADAATEASVGLGSVIGGLGLPHSFPHGFGSATPATVSAANLGGITTPATIRFEATTTLIAPAVERLESGRKLQLTSTIAPGDFYELDLDLRTVLLNGTANRSNELKRPESQWFQLDPDANTLRFSAASGDGLMRVTWRHAYNFG